jgi:hypothetical protein
MPVTADVVFWGIRSGIKLAQQGRQAYIEATINRELTLPLPNYNPEVSVGTAEGYFSGAGKSRLKENARIKELYEISMDVDRQLTKKEKKEFIELYLDFKREEDIKSGAITGGELGLSKDALLSLVTVRQWAAKMTPFPSVYQRVIGSLIDIGIDYFANTPGVIEDKSSSGRVIKGFLQSIDELNFAQENVNQLAKSLFVATLETMEENPNLLGGDEKTEQLVEAVARGLLKDARRLTAELAHQDLAKEEEINAWASLVFRSLLSNVGYTVLANPKTYLAVDDTATETLIASVGTSVLDTIITEDSVDLSEVLSREGLDSVLSAALFALAENPSLMGVDHKGLRKLLSQIAKDLAQSSLLLNPDIIPEVMRLVLERTAAHADVLWPDAFQQPEKHLLVTASRELLSQLAKPPTSGDRWTPKLTKSQILGVVETILDEVVQNPEWLMKEAERERVVLAEVVESIMTTLRKVPGNRLSADTGMEVLKSAIKAVALRKNFVDKITVDGAQKQAIAATLETLIDACLADEVEPQARWTLARGEVFSLIAETALASLAEMGISEANLSKVKELIRETADDLASGRPWKLQKLIENISSLAA